MDTWPLATLMSFAAGGCFLFGDEADGVAVLALLFERLGVLAPQLVERNSRSWLQRKEGVHFAKMGALSDIRHPCCRGGVSPDLAHVHSWVGKIFQRAEESRPTAIDFVNGAEAAR